MHSAKTSSESVAVPKWFCAEMTTLFALYPSATLEAPTILAWWRHLQKLPAAALVQAFRKAPASSSLFCPSAEVVRQVADPIARTLAHPVQNLEVPALPEPELTLPEDNPFFETLERFKRGEIPRRQAAAAAREIVRAVTESIDGEESEAAE